MEYSDLPVNEEVDAAVNIYCETIVEYIKAMDPDVDFDVEKEYIANEKHTQRALMADIQSEFGFVTIFPDFKKNAAAAALLNRGLVRAMDIEGFDDDTINKAPLYGKTMPFSVENAEMFAVILTQDLELQHQKLLEE